MIFKRCKHEKCACPWWYEFVINGRRYRKTTRTNNRQLATRLETTRRNAVIEGKPDQIVSPLLGAFIKDYLAAIEEEHRTAYKAVGTLLRFRNSVGNLPLDKITTFAIDKWKIARAKEVKPSTVNRELNIIAGMFTRAVEWEQLTETPVNRKLWFKVDDERVRVLSDDEIARILAAVPIAYQLVFRLTLESLPRLSEVLALRREHVGPNWIEIRRKGGKVSRIPISSTLRDDLLSYAGTRTDIFADLPSAPAVSSYITRIMRGMGIQGVSHHTWRHTGVTWMLEAGKNPRVIQVAAGWSSLRMLQRYGHVRDTELQGAVNANAQRLASIPTPDPTAAPIASVSKAQ